MKNLLVFIFVLVSIQLFSQTDSVVVETYDLVYLKNGDIVKGQIISFDPSDGDITMISEDGRKYFLTSEDYSSFKENIPAKKKKRKKEDFKLHERKENQYELSVGFTAPAYFITAEKTEEADIHLPFDRSYMPICLSVGYGKYINRKHFVGLDINFGATPTVKSFYSVNAKYRHQYDAYKKNVALYIPIELTYNHFRNKMPFNLDQWDTTEWGSSYPTIEEYDVAFNTIGLNIGQGFAFILSQKNSISFEVALFKYYGISKKYFNLSVPDPSYSYSVQGFKLNLMYNF